jgi:predicted permease
VIGRIREIVERILWWFRGCKLDREFREELATHIQMAAEDNIRAGMSPEEARRNALIKLGGLDKAIEVHRDRQGFSWFAELQRNLRYALRIIWKQKALSLTVIGLLAIACGANFTVFSYYNGYFLQPLPFPNGDRLVDLDETAPKWNQEHAYIDYTDLYQWQKENHSFEKMAAYYTPYRFYFRKGNTNYIWTMIVGEEFPSIFQIKPVLGRTFLKEEYRQGGPKPALLGYRFWQEEFGQSPSALGETIKLDGEVYTVVGVLPGDANFPVKAAVWTPLQWSPNNASDIYFMRGIGVLKKGVSIGQAQQDLTRIHKNMIDVRPANAITAPRLQLIRERQFGGLDYLLLIFQAAGAILLLIACANIAGMMLARSESRSREMGIRAALGSSRAGIVRQLLTEGLLLAMPGTLLGLLLGQLFLKITFLWLGEPPPWVKIVSDIRVFAFCGLLTGVATVLFGLAPALQAASVNTHRMLHEGSTRVSASGPKRRGLDLLVVAEIALAFVMLVGAGLLLRTWQKTQDIDPGFQIKNVLTFMIQMPAQVYKQPTDWARFFEQFINRCRQVPGVLAVSGAMPQPMSGGVTPHNYEIEGIRKAAGEPDPPVQTRTVLPDYFETMNIPLISGRAFTEQDEHTKEAGVAIVNQSCARLFWPTSDPIGKRIRISSQTTGDVSSSAWMTVVGIGHDNKENGLDRATPPVVYRPYNQYLCPLNAMFMVIRSKVDPVGLIGPIRAQLRQMDPEMAVLVPSTMNDLVDQYVLPRRHISIIMMIGAAAGLLIAAAGIFGVVSYSVSRRTQEIGIRMALGATKPQVLRMVFKGGARLMIIGAVLGAVGAVAASQFLRSMLFGVTSLDPLTYIVGGLLIVGVVLTATLLPARRAASVDPIRALRSE